MIKYYVVEGIDEYPNDPESVSFIDYDCYKLFVEKSIIKDKALRDRLLELLMYSYYTPMKDGMKSKIIASKHGKIPYKAWGGNRPHSVLNDGGCIYDKDGEAKFIFQIQINDYPDLITGEEIIKKMANTVSLYLEDY